MSELLDRARTIYESLPIADLKAAGIWPAPDYELVFNYPPYYCLDPVDSRIVFPEHERVLPGPRPVAIYVHIPFCQSICAYCHYARRAGWTTMDIDLYLSTLRKEAMFFRRLYKTRIFEAQSLHVGGGTPSLLGLRQLDKLMEVLHQAASFPLDIERTIEANPATISRPWLVHTRDLGFNRLNVGVQSFDDKLLKVCRRPHTARQAIEAIELARESGFENINVDLMFGLPGQTFEQWEATLKTLIQLQPASVTCYKLRRKLGTVFGRLPSELFPSVEDQLLMHIMAIEGLTDAGYLPWHFETLFVRDPKFTHKQQEWKWQESGELLGLGVSAYSYLNQCVYHNTQDQKEYLDLLAQNRLPIAVGRHLTNSEQMHRWMVLGLMMLKVEQEPFRQRFSINPSATFAEPLQRLEGLGLIKVTDKTIQVTQYPGLLFPMEIMTQFYTPEDTARLQAEGLHYGSFPVR